MDPVMAALGARFVAAALDPRGTLKGPSGGGGGSSADHHRGMLPEEPASRPGPGPCGAVRGGG